MKKLLIIFLLFWSSIAFANDAEFEKGLAAATEGNFKKASEIFEPLAKLGNPLAQYNLGALYMTGRGVPRSSIHAYVWFNIAEANGYEKAREPINQLSEVLTSAQLHDAERLSVQCLNSNYKNCY